MTQTGPDDGTHDKLDAWLAEIGVEDVQPIIGPDGDVIEYRSIFDD